MNVGDPVRVHWTSTNRQYHGKGTIKKINRKTLIVELTDTVDWHDQDKGIGNRGIRGTGLLYAYKVGTLIQVPIEGTPCNFAEMEESA